MDVGGSSKSLYPSQCDLEDCEELRKWRESLKQQVEEVGIEHEFLCTTPS